MAGELDALPRREVQKNLSPRLLDFLLDDEDFLFKADAQRVFLRVGAEFIELILQFDNGLFEVEPVFHALGILVALGG